MRHAFLIAEVEHETWLSRRGATYVLHFEGRDVPIALTPSEGARQALRVGEETCEVVIANDGDLVHIHVDGTTFTVRYVDPVLRYAVHAGCSADDIAEAPMPGVVIAVHVDEGQEVALGDTLLVIESMKLETAVRAWREGMVAAVHVAVGQAFDRGAALLTLAPQTGT